MISKLVLPWFLVMTSSLIHKTTSESEAVSSNVTNLTDAADMKDFDEKYTDYLKEQTHVLYGWHTPVFLGRLNTTIQNSFELSVVYDKMYYVRKKF